MGLADSQSPDHACIARHFQHRIVEKNVTEKPTPELAIELVQLLTGKWMSRAIHAAAELSIADILQDEELGLDELARRTHTHAPSLYRLLRALGSIGIFRESGPRRFVTTPRGALLRDGSMRAACLMAHSTWHEAAWSELLHSLRTGESGFEQAHGQPMFEWFREHPEAARLFSQTMSAGSAYRDHGVADCYDFSRFECLIDVGGANGSLALSILERYPTLRAVVADLPHVVAGAKLAIDAAGLAERCETAACDFFESLPVNADVYVLAHILHDWDDASCERILVCCRGAMRHDSTLLIVESLMPEDNGFDRLKWLDLEMLVLTEGGRERAESEYRLLLQAAGLELRRMIPTRGSRCVLEVTRASRTNGGQS